MTEDDIVTLHSVPDTIKTVSTTPEEELLQQIPPVTIHREDDDDDDEILWSLLPDNLPSEQEQLQPAAATANLLDLADQYQQCVVSPVSDHLPLHDDNNDDNDDNDVLAPPLLNASPPHLPYLPDSVEIEDEHVDSFFLNIVNSQSFKHPQAVNEIMYQLRM